MPFAALAARGYAARDRLPPNNFAVSLDFAGGQIQDRATSHTSTGNDASKCIENLRRRTLLVSAGNRRRARRDVRLRASSLPWTPAPKTSSQFPVYGKASPGCKDFPEHGLVTLCPRFIYA